MSHDGVNPPGRSAFDRFVVGMNALGSIWILFLILLGLTVLAFRTLHRKVHYA